MNASKLDMKILKLRIKRKLPRRVCGIRKIWSMMREYRYEWACKKFSSQFGYEYYHPLEFQLRLFLAWLFYATCKHCDEDGMTGYYEREACSWCDGFHLRWNWTLRGWIRNSLFTNKMTEEVSYYEMDKNIGAK